MSNTIAINPETMKLKKVFVSRNPESALRLNQLLIDAIDVPAANAAIDNFLMNGDEATFDTDFRVAIDKLYEKVEGTKQSFFNFTYMGEGFKPLTWHGSKWFTQAAKKQCKNPDSNWNRGRVVPLPHAASCNCFAISGKCAGAACHKMMRTSAIAERLFMPRAFAYALSAMLGLREVNKVGYAVPFEVVPETKSIAEKPVKAEKPIENKGNGKIEALKAKAAKSAK